MLSKQKSYTNGILIGKHNVTLHWIIDSTDTNLMFEDLKKLHDLRDIPSCHIGLPNESQTFATKERTIRLDEHLTLDNSLHVPGLTCHLISIWHLYDTSTYSVNLLMMYELCRIVLEGC